MQSDWPAPPGPLATAEALKPKMLATARQAPNAVCVILRLTNLKPLRFFRHG